MFQAVGPAELVQESDEAVRLRIMKRDRLRVVIYRATSRRLPGSATRGVFGRAKPA